MPKQRKMRRHNPMAKALADPRYRKRVVKSKKLQAKLGYAKHKNLSVKED